jgi:hypothetical protein
MDPELTKRLDTLEDKVDLIYISVEKTRKYFLTTAIITVLAVVLPMIGLVFAIPTFLNNYVGQIDSLSQ